MHANVGDWLLLRARTESQHPRRAAIVGVGDDGAPPYTVRWVEDDHESLIFPGPDAEIVTAREQRARDRKASRRITAAQRDIASHRTESGGR